MIAPHLALLLHRLSAAAPASAAINHLLAQEPWARTALQRHGGKVAAIDSGAVVLRLQVMPDGYLQPAPDGEERTNRTPRRFREIWAMAALAPDRGAASILRRGQKWAAQRISVEHSSARRRAFRPSSALLAT